METSPLLTVFAVSNDSACELFVGTTPLVFSEFIARTKADKPEAIRHWRPRDKIAYLSLAFDLTRLAAAQYVERYLETLEGSSFRIILDPQTGLTMGRRRRFGAI